jgi:hypothetical protein
MLTRYPRLGLVCLCLFLVTAASASAEVVRYRYAPKDACGNTALVPGPNGAPGERSAFLGGPTEPYPKVPAPTHMVTYLHPISKRNVIVPMTFPQGTPRIETRGDRILYNWSGYQVQARFRDDGSVEVIYNSGVLRPISFQ